MSAQPDFRLVNWGIRIEKPIERQPIYFVGHFIFKCQKFKCKYGPNGSITAFNYEEKGTSEEVFIFNTNMKILASPLKCSICGADLQWMPADSHIKKVNLTS